jgi:hypothetical protein
VEILYRLLDVLTVVVQLAKPFIGVMSACLTSCCVSYAARSATKGSHITELKYVHGCLAQSNSLILVDSRNGQACSSSG